MFLNCTFILKPYLGELLRDSFNFACYFSDIFSLKVCYFILMNIFFILSISSFFSPTSACFYLRCSLNSYPTFMAVVTSFTYSGLQTYLFYILLILHYYLYFVCNTHCLTIGICGSFLVFFFLFVSKCQFSTFSFSISICAHLSLDIMWFFLIRQKNWRGTENASFIFYPWQPVSEGVAWLRTSWLSYTFPPFTTQGMIM